VYVDAVDMTSPNSHSHDAHFIPFGVIISGAERGTDSRVVSRARADTPIHTDNFLGVKFTRSTSPPLDQFPLRVCMCPLCIINRL